MVTVVTGASGFLGSVVVRDLLATGRQVRAVDLHRGPALDGLDVEWVQADVTDPSTLEPAFREATVVYHLAAMISVTGDPTGRVRAVNVDGVRNASRAALTAGVSRFVHCSSVHAFDLETTEEPINEQSARATNPALPAYDRSKAAGEAALRQVIEQGLDATIVNPTGIIGPFDFAPSRMGQVFLALAQRRLPAVIDAGFDWVDVRDVSAAALSAETRGRTGENYLLPGHHVSLTQIAAIAEEITGTPAPRWKFPMRLARVWGPIGDIAGRRTDSVLWYTSESLHALRFSPAVSGAKAATELGHHPRPFFDSVEDTYRWFDAQDIPIAP